MASGSQNMTTYNARVVTGSNSAASPAGALLLSGAGRADDATGDTWLFLDSRGGTSTPWGIKHDQANNKIQIFGAGTNSVWTQMNTGNTYILGKVGINTESPSAKLHIYQATNNAATQHEPALRIEGKLDIYDNATGGGVANSLLNILYNGTHEYGVPVKIHSYGGDSPAIRFSKSASIDDINKEVNTSWTVGMYYNSSNAFAITRGRGPAGWGTADLMIDSSGQVGIGTTAPAYKLDISGTAHISDTTTLGSRETSTAPSALSSVDRLIITPYYHTGGPWKITSKDDASNAYLSLYYSTIETARMQHNGTLLLCNNISFTNSGTAFRGINYGTMGDNDQWRIGGAATAANAGYMELATADDGNEPIYVRQYTGVFTTVKRTLTLLDASGNTTFPGSFYFGGDGIYHSGTAATQRIIRIIDSGDQYGTGISIGAGGLALFGSGESTSTVISNLSLTAGGTETTYITSDNAIYFYSNQNSYNANMYMSMNNSQLLISGSTSGGMAHNTTNPKITFVENQSTQPVHLIYTDQDSYRAPAGLKIVGGASATPAWFEVEGNIYNGGSIYTTKAGECGLEVNNTQATNPNQGAFIVGSSGNLGIYSRKHSKWVVACDASGNVSLNGNAATATTWQTARTLTVGNKGQSVNGSANVSWSLNDILYNATTIGTSTSWDQTGPSVYYVASSAGFTGTNHPGNNSEIMPYTYGQLIVSRAGSGGVLQIYAPHTGSGGAVNAGLRYRTGWNSAGWHAWSTLLDDRLWRKYIFCNKNINRSQLTVSDSTWAVTSGIDLFGLSFKDSGLTYTPSGGSATTATDTGDWRAWLTCASNSNTVELNMRIDGSWQAGKFIGPLQGNADTATKATQDGSGNTITSYYCTLSTAQTFTGNKTFNSICYFANGTTYYVNKNGDCRLRYLGCGNLDASTSYAIRIGGNAYISGHHYFGNGTTYYINSSGTGNLNALTVNATTASSSTGTGALIVKGGIGAAGNIYGSKVFGAVWNDYAEYREVETEEPGYCVTETKDRRMIKTNKRLQPGCKITSDTFGICMGQTKTARTPIAIAGRVLVYPYRNSIHYQLGDAVCSAPGGTVDLMTRDEIMMYPERIVGTVSEIPDYEVWHSDVNGKEEIQVNGRIWIYVK